MSLINGATAGEPDEPQTPSVCVAAMNTSEVAVEPVLFGSDALAPLKIVKVPPTVVGFANVFTPPERVRLLNVDGSVEIDWAPPPKTTVPVDGLNTELVPPQVAFAFNVPEPPFNVPEVRVTLPVNVFGPEPRLRVPAPEPAIVKAPPFIVPEIVAVPALLLRVTGPVVVNPAILCATAPERVNPPDPLVIVPVPPRIRSPPRVKRFAPGVNVAPVLIVSGMPSLKVLPAESVIVPPLITTPLAAANGVTHSKPAAKVPVLLY